MVEEATMTNRQSALSAKVPTVVIFYCITFSEIYALPRKVTLFEMMVRILEIEKTFNCTEFMRNHMKCRISKLI